MPIPDWAWKGLRCIWLHTPQDGFGFTLRLPVRILRCEPLQAQVYVEHAGVTQNVPYENLLDTNMRHEDGRQCVPPKAYKPHGNPQEDGEEDGEEDHHLQEGDQEGHLQEDPAVPRQA